MVPTFSFHGFKAPAPLNDRPPRNGTDYSRPATSTGKVFSTDMKEVDPEMGAIPNAVLAMTGHARGNHPHCSFTAIGPLARALIAGQRPDDVFAPLRALAAIEGFVVLMGVGLDRMTLIHLAEQEAGRRMFIGWFAAGDGSIRRAEAGGCSRGFGSFEPALAGVVRSRSVGVSDWLVYPAQAALELATDAIRLNPSITRCADSACLECPDAIAGGPIG